MELRAVLGDPAFDHLRSFRWFPACILLRCGAAADNGPPLVGGGFALSDDDRGDLYDTYAPLLMAEGIDIDGGDDLVGAGRLGIGFDWCITQHLVLNTEAGIVVTTLKAPDIEDIEDLNYLSFQMGLQYRF